MINLNPKAKWIQFNHPLGGDWYRWGDTSVHVERHEDGMWHMSISCPNRYPTWTEIHSAWYDLVPGAGKDFEGGIILPRKSEYVNIHPNCFHVHQLLGAEVPAGIIL